MAVSRAGAPARGGDRRDSSGSSPQHGSRSRPARVSLRTRPPRTRRPRPAPAGTRATSSWFSATWSGSCARPPRTCASPRAGGGTTSWRTPRAPGWVWIRRATRTRRSCFPWSPSPRASRGTAATPRCSRWSSRTGARAGSRPSPAWTSRGSTSAAPCWARARCARAAAPRWGRWASRCASTSAPTESRRSSGTSDSRRRRRRRHRRRGHAARRAATRAASVSTPPPSTEATEVRRMPNRDAEAATTRKKRRRNAKSRNAGEETSRPETCLAARARRARVCGKTPRSPSVDEPRGDERAYWRESVCRATPSRRASCCAAKSTRRWRWTAPRRRA